MHGWVFWAASAWVSGDGDAPPERKRCHHKDLRSYFVWLYPEAGRVIA